MTFRAISLLGRKKMLLTINRDVLPISDADIAAHPCIFGPSYVIVYIPLLSAILVAKGACGCYFFATHPLLSSVG